MSSLKRNNIQSRLLQSISKKSKNDFSEGMGSTPVLTYKPSNACSDFPSTYLVSVFETFPNELVILIFEHLKLVDIVQSFGHLNKRFNLLIGTYKTSVSLCSLSATMIEQIVPWICEYVVSLKIDRFIFPVDSNGDLFRTFPRLKHLSISKIDGNFSRKLLPFSSNSFKRLTKLELKIYELENFWIENVIQQDCLLEEFYFISDTTSPRLTSAQFSMCSLTVLDICLNNADDLCILFNFLSKIKKIKCRLLHESTNKIITTTTAETPFLKEFSLKFTDSRIDWITTASLLKDRRSIERLSLDLVLSKKGESSQINGDTLHEELLQYLTNLELFQFHFKIYYSSPPKLSNIMSTFKSDFWLKQNDWKVGGFFDQNQKDTPLLCYLFSLPYGSSRFEYRLNLNPTTYTFLKANVPLSSNLFNNVKFMRVCGPGNIDWGFFKFLEKHFEKLNNLVFNPDVHNNIGEIVTQEQQQQLKSLHLKNVKLFSYCARSIPIFEQLLLMLPNLHELVFDFYKHIGYQSGAVHELASNIGSTLLQLIDLKKLEHLKSVTLEDINVYSDIYKLTQYFKTHLPNITFNVIDSGLKDYDENND